jgi:hypothetical protein
MTVHSKLSEDGKFFILDFLAEDILGRRFNIEVPTSFEYCPGL